MRKKVANQSENKPAPYFSQHTAVQKPSLAVMESDKYFS